MAKINKITKKSKKKVAKNTLSKIFTDKQIDKIMEYRVKGFNYNEIAAFLTENYKQFFKESQVSVAFRQFSDLYNLPPIEKHPEKLAREARQKIIDKYLAFVKQKNLVPTYYQLHSEGDVNSAKIKKYFNSLADLHEHCRENYPDVFGNIIDEDYFTDDLIKEIHGNLKGKKRFLITSAVANTAPHKKFHKAIQTWLKKNKDGVDVYLPCADPAKKKGRNSGFQLDPFFADKNVLFGDTYLNRNVFLSNIKVTAKQLNPLTGLERIGQRNGLFIYSSPKQIYNTIHTGSHAQQRALATPGACTVDDYATAKYMSERTRYIAEKDHKLGALIVEIVDGKRFYIRSILANPKTGNFYDLDKQYCADGKVRTKKRAEVLSIGDLHIGEQDDKVMEAQKTLASILKPKYLTLDDTFDAKSINHHERKNLVAMVKKYRTGQVLLADELERAAEYLDNMASTWDVDNIVIKYSNHDDFILRYLQTGDYEHINRYISLKLELGVHEGRHNPFQYAMEEVYPLNNLKKFIFLEQDESFVIDGVRHDVHGHVGPSGTRSPSPATLDRSYGAVTPGHLHSGGIFRNVFRVGTSTKLKLNYNRGASNWNHACVIQHKGGYRQLVLIFDGKFSLDHN